MKDSEPSLIVAETTKPHSRILPGAAFAIMIGLCGCVSTGGDGETAEMTNEYGDPIGSTADQQVEMEEQMNAVTNSLIR